MFCKYGICGLGLWVSFFRSLIAKFPSRFFVVGSAYLSYCYVTIVSMLSSSPTFVFYLLLRYENLSIANLFFAVF